MSKSNKRRSGYKQDYTSALSELKENHETEWKLLHLLFRAKIGRYDQCIWSLVKREMVKAYHEEFHANLKIYRSNYK